MVGSATRRLCALSGLHPTTLFMIRALSAVVFDFVWFFMQFTSGKWSETKLQVIFCDMSPLLHVRMQRVQYARNILWLLPSHLRDGVDCQSSGVFHFFLEIPPNYRRLYSELCSLLRFSQTFMAFWRSFRTRILFPTMRLILYLELLFNKHSSVIR